tara:strand:- start:439 stop:1116 length:678 start_codon:yes stop_codon:yes gene_type:complete
MSKFLIQIKNISKHYIKNNVSVLKKINISFKKGKIYSIVGPSGSGKTTLLNIISMVEKPNSGKLSIQNSIINFNDNSSNDKIRAEKIGIIYQDKNLLSDFTALENIYLAKLALSNDENNAKNIAKKIIKSVGLINRQNHYPSELSGGENQRIAICRAIINNPEIIIADEPTGSLDQKNSKEIFKLLFNLRNKNNVIIFATHNTYFSNLADYKLQIKDGSVKYLNV